MRSSEKISSESNTPCGVTCEPSAPTSPGTHITSSPSSCTWTEWLR